MRVDVCFIVCVCAKYQFSVTPRCYSEAPSALRVVQHRTRRPAPEPLDVFPGNARTSLLIKWAQAACMLQPGGGGVRVADFKSSFGDGRVLCYLVRSGQEKCKLCFCNFLLHPFNAHFP